jgi:zinc transporter 5/7
LIFMVVELFYGLMANSLGLISDSIHMLFDCGALAIGLYGAYMSKWKNNHTFTFGYGRYQVLSGFVNGLLLLFIGIYIFFEAIHRFFDQIVISDSRILPVSVVGLLINISGVLIFKYASTYSEENQNGQHFDENLHGVFLHMVADTLASISLIVSTLLIKYYQWYAADAICSLIISCIIFFAAYPLIVHSVDVLLLRSPQNYQSLIDNGIEKLKTTKGVLQVYNIHFWAMNSDQFVGTLHIKADDDVNEQELLVMIAEDFAPCQVTTQIEKKKFLTNNDKSMY